MPQFLLKRLTCSASQGEHQGYEEGAGFEAGGAEVALDGLSVSFADAPVGGRYRTDGELAAFFTSADEQFMVRRTLSRLVEMCGEGEGAE